MKEDGWIHVAVVFSWYSNYRIHMVHLKIRKAPIYDVSWTDFCF